MAIVTNTFRASGATTNRESLSDVISRCVMICGCNSMIVLIGFMFLRIRMIGLTSFRG